MCLHWAAMLGHGNIVRVLLDNGADAAAPDQVLGVALCSRAGLIPALAGSRSFSHVDR